MEKKTRKLRYDFTGQRFGKILVLERDLEYEKNKNLKGSYVYWKCKCDCGRIVTYTSSALRKGNITECTHCKNIIDLTGQVFDALTVLGDVGKRDKKQVEWKCQCVCGNIVYRKGYELKKKENFHSCGCLQNLKQIKDISNQRFGKVTAISPNFLYKKENNIKSSACYWNCICDCGREFVADSANLQSGGTQSCGCCSVSRGEDKIKMILIENNIPFECQKTFKDCKDKGLLRFDFYIDNKYLIEYDGRQHYKDNQWEKVENIQRRDFIKDNYCIKNNIPLIRIPYTKFNTLCLQDLLLETTKFLI